MSIRRTIPKRCLGDILEPITIGEVLRWDYTGRSEQIFASGIDTGGGEFVFPQDSSLPV